MPSTSDVKYMLEIFVQLGGTATWVDDATLSLNAAGVNSTSIDPLLSQKMKASVMYSGPLLARFGKVSMPLPQ